MNLEQLAYLAEIIGVILVIASLIYVAQQLRQTTSAVLAQSRQSVLTAAQTELSYLIEFPKIAQGMSPDVQLDRTDQVRLNLFLIAAMRAREYAWLQYNNGVIDQAQWETELAVIDLFLTSSRVRSWWERRGRAGVSDDFGDFIEKRAPDISITDDYWVGQQEWLTG